jgi:hypothetical protein
LQDAHRGAGLGLVEACDGAKVDLVVEQVLQCRRRVVRVVVVVVVVIVGVVNRALPVVMVVRVGHGFGFSTRSNLGELDSILLENSKLRNSRRDV